jgi:hypothetical protein
MTTRQATKTHVKSFRAPMQLATVTDLHPFPPRIDLSIFDYPPTRHAPQPGTSGP